MKKNNRLFIVVALVLCFITISVHGEGLKNDISENNNETVENENINQEEVADENKKEETKEDDVLLNHKKSSESSDVRKGVGYSIKETFPDIVLAEIIAKEMSKKNNSKIDVNTILTDDMINSLYHLSFYMYPESVNLKSLEGIEYLSSCTRVDLYNTKITNIDVVTKVSQLSELRLVSNQKLESIPENLGDNSKLRVLEINNNDLIKSIPDSINNLKKMVFLTISDNDLITEVPDSLGNLEQLILLKISQSKITKLPEDIGKLKKLETLDLSIEETGLLTELPEGITELENLKNLYVSKNFNVSNIKEDSFTGIIYPITKLPSGLNKLKNLEVLQLDNLMLKEIPEELSELSKLWYLRFDYNEVSEIPEWISKSKTLTTLSFEYNKIASLSEEFVSNYDTVYGADLPYTHYFGFEGQTRNVELVDPVDQGSTLSIDAYPILTQNYADYLNYSVPTNGWFTYMLYQLDYNGNRVGDGIDITSSVYNTLIEKNKIELDVSFDEGKYEIVAFPREGHLLFGKERYSTNRHNTFYTWKFNVLEKSNTAPKIVGDNLYIIDIGENFNELDGLTISDLETSYYDLIIEVSKDVVDNNTAGIYYQQISVSDLDGANTIFNRIVLVNDGSYVVGDSTILKANDFKVSTDDVDTGDKAIKDAAKLKAYDKQTGIDITLSTEVNVDSGAYKAEAGEYSIKFTVATDNKIEKTVTATVINNPVKPIDPPFPTDPPVENLGCGENSFWNEDLRMCICESDFINWEGAGIGCLTEYVPPVVDPIVDPEIPEETETPDVSETPENTESPEPALQPDIKEPTVEEIKYEKVTSIISILFILLTIVTAAFILSGKNDDKDNQNLMKFKVIGIVLSIVSVVVFFLTGGIQSTFVMFDSLTLVFGIIFATSLGVLGLERFTISKQ
ncbi:MAG: leucine-rich repeat domain-containing protein [Anaerorhabdus sp.]